MSEATETPTQSAESAENEKTFTQAEVDAIVGDRLKRERAKHADYSELKAKAARLDEIEAASKSELEKAVERAEKAEQALADIKAAAEVAALRAEVAKEKGVDAELLRGTTREELEEHADAIKAFAGNAPRFGSVPDFGEAKPPAGKKGTAELFADAVNGNQ